MNSGQIVVNMLSTAKERGRLGKRVEGEVRKKERGGGEGRGERPLALILQFYHCQCIVSCIVVDVMC